MLSASVSLQLYAQLKSYLMTAFTTMWNMNSFLNDEEYVSSSNPEFPCFFFPSYLHYIRILAGVVTS